MTTINDLPAELLCLVFEELLVMSRTLPGFSFASKRSHYASVGQESQSCDCDDLNTLWNIEEFGHISTSPFVLNRVCRRWYHTASYSPQFWTHLIFDVSRPIHHLQIDALQLSASLPLLLYVFCNERISKEDENTRVALIKDALSQHISRCVSVIFKVQYASSLHSLAGYFIEANAHLEELRVECRIHDSIPTPIQHLSSSLSGLQYLSLNGGDLMSFNTCDLLQLRNMGGSADGLTLRVSDLTLTRNADGHPFDVFMNILDHLPNISDLILLNVTLSSRPRKRRNIDRAFEYRAERFVFIYVCPNFLSDFFNSSSTIGARQITFVGCSIPRMRAMIIGDLRLIDIPSNSRPALLDQSIRNILSTWHGDTLHVSECISFTEESLLRLASCEVALFMRRIVFRDCPNITPLGVRHLLTMRQEDKLCPSVTSIIAEGNVPPLEEDDVRWFRRWKKDNLQSEVQWAGFIF